MRNLNYTHGKFNRREIDYISFYFFQKKKHDLTFFPENKIWHFMQILSNGDNLHEMSTPVFWKK